MRKLSVVFFISIFFWSFTSSASHLNGGELTWKCLGGNQYIFNLEIFKTCNGYNLGSVYITGPQMVIPVNPVDTITLVRGCAIPASKSCSSASAWGKTIKVIYQSSVVTLNGTPPVSGWTFSYQLQVCCGPSTNNAGGFMTTITSVMYPKAVSDCISSPFSITNPAVVITPPTKSYSVMAGSDDPRDSLYYKDGYSNAFHSGYSAASPFPNHQTNPVNAPGYIDRLFGLFLFDISVGLNGTYLHSTTVEQWRDGALVSKIERLNTADGDFSAISNVAPIVDIDTNSYNITKLADWNYEVDGYPGDTVFFRMMAVDTGQQIKFAAAGLALDSTWASNNGFNSKANLTPAMSQMGFEAADTNVIEFSWVLGNEHVFGNETRYLFHFEFIDDYCPYAAINNLALTVLVKKGVSINQDTVVMCQGDSAQLNAGFGSGKYLWQPAQFISDSSIADPLVYPDSSGYYYLLDPDHPQFKDSVFVQVEQRSVFDLNYNAGLLTLNNPGNAGSKLWYINNIPFLYSHDTLTPFCPGDYRATANSQNCKYYSDTISVQPGSYSMADPGNGQVPDDYLVLTGTMGATFQVDSSAEGFLYKLVIPGIEDLPGKTGGEDLSLKLYDSQQAVVWSKDTTITGFTNGLVEIGLNYRLQKDVDYTLTVTGDTGYAFHYFENVNLPSRPFNDGLLVTTLFADSTVGFPTTATDKLLPVVLQIEQTIGVEEPQAKGFKVYPNPARESFVIEGAQRGTIVQLLNLKGQLLFEGLTVEGKLTIHRKQLPAGVYLLKLSDDRQSEVRKVIFE